MATFTCAKILLPESCHVYIGRIQVLRPVHLGMLDDVERLRSAEYRFPSDRKRFELGAVLLRLGLSRTLSTHPARLKIDRTCDVCGRPHGRPRVIGFDGYISVSHSGNLVMVAITAAGPVGIDVEVATGLPCATYLEILELVVTEAERPFVDSLAAFLKVWTRKEAILKATGYGLRASMADVVVSAPHQKPCLISLGKEMTVPCFMREIDVGSDCCATLAVMTELAIDVLVQDADPLLNVDMEWRGL